MRLNPLASALMRSIWMIEPDHAHNLYLLAENYLDGTYVVADEEKLPLVATAIAGNGDVVSLAEAKGEGLIALIPVLGPIMKEDYCGDPGTATMGNWIKQANANPAIDAIILQIDSPGGSVDGTKSFADIISSSQKPVIGFVDGLCASAAYWIGGACDEIISSNTTDLIGSIGTMCTLYDFREYYKARGMTKHDIYADASKHKNQDYQQALDGDYKTIKNEILNPLNDEFVSAVKSNRGDKLNTKENSGVLSGKLFTAQLALANGLIDSIGTFDTAVSRAHELASRKKDPNYSEEQKTSLAMKKFIVALFPTIAAFLGMKEDGEFTDEHMKKVEGELATHTQVKGERDDFKTKLDTATADLQAAKTKNDELQASLTEMTEKKDKWKEKAKKFGAEDAADVKETKLGGDKRPGATDEKEKAKLVNEPFDAELEKLGL